MRTVTPFFKLLQNHEEFGKVYNIWIVLLPHTNKTVYHMHRSDKQLKSLNLQDPAAKNKVCAFFCG